MIDPKLDPQVFASPTTLLQHIISKLDAAGNSRDKLYAVRNQLNAWVETLNAPPVDAPPTVEADLVAPAPAHEPLRTPPNAASVHDDKALESPLPRA